MFSKTCEYAIKATVFIAISSYEGGRVSPKEIAKEINSPKAFTAKILQSLVKHNIVNSVKGSYGGFEIDKNVINCIKISEIVTAIDGDAIFKNCALGLETCKDEHPCPLHDQFKDIRERLKEVLENTTLKDLALNFQSGSSFLKI